MAPSLRRRLLASYVTVAALGLGFTVAAFMWSLQRETLRQVRTNLQSQVRVAASILSPVYRSDSTSAFQDRVRSLGALIGARMTWIAPDGRVLADSYETYEALSSLENHRHRPEIAQAAESGIGSSIRYSDTVHMRMLYVALAVRGERGDGGFVRVAFPLADLDARVHRLAWLVGGGAAAALALTILMGLRFTRQIAGPVREMALTAREIARGDFGRQAAVPDDDELGDLSRALNRMSIEVRNRIDQITRDGERLRGILAGMVEGVLVLDHAGRILLANEALDKMFGLPPGAAVGASCTEVIRHHELNEFLHTVFSGRDEARIEITTHAPPVRAYTVQASVLRSPAGEATGVVLVFHDITELKRLETVRKDFVANVSHELKTPLTAVKGFIEALIDGAKDDPEQSVRFLDILRRQADHLDAIVSDLLRLSAIESGKIAPVLVDVALAAAVERIASAEAPEITKRGHRLIVEIPGDLTVRADPRLLEQVVQNLLDNAVKYTPDGGEIAVRAEAGEGRIILSVRDTGIGIPDKDQARIFERFYRVDRARSRELGGTGLGLSIVKHIADAHGWTVSVESVPGRGSTFAVRIPT